MVDGACVRRSDAAGSAHRQDAGRVTARAVELRVVDDKKVRVESASGVVVLSDGDLLGVDDDGGVFRVKDGKPKLVFGSDDRTPLGDLEEVFGDSFDRGTNLVDVHTAKLCKRLMTVRGIGYRIAADANPNLTDRKRSRGCRRLRRLGEERLAPHRRRPRE